MSMNYLVFATHKLLSRAPQRTDFYIFSSLLSRTFFIFLLLLIFMLLLLIFMHYISVITKNTKDIFLQTKEIFH